MKYGTVCSGIDAPREAWNPLGWTQSFCSEIEPFACAVLKHHAPEIPNFGDMTKYYKEWNNDGTTELICGGTPCQSFSVAGLRKGMADPRGNLALVFLGVVDRFRPQWVVWENVPGVLSSNEGRDFGAFLGGLGQLGYQWAYRVLDAEYVRVDGLERAVPQRRRRVFVVGYLGSWTYPAAALFEQTCLSGNPPPSREAGKGTTRSVAHSLGSGGNLRHREDQDTLIPAVACTLPASTGGVSSGMHPCVPAVARTLNARYDSSPCADRGMDVIPAVVGCLDTNYKRKFGCNQQVTTPGHLLPVAFHENQRAEVTCSETAGSLKAGGGKPGQGYPAAMIGMQVRRLTPTECERLMGFPDGFTAIPWRGKSAEQCPDGPRYRVLGNSMAVNVMRWIGTRIQMVENTFNFPLDAASRRE